MSICLGSEARRLCSVPGAACMPTRIPHRTGDSTWRLPWLVVTSKCQRKATSKGYLSISPPD